MFFEGEKRNRTAEAIVASNTVSDRRVPKVKIIQIQIQTQIKIQKQIQIQIQIQIHIQIKIQIQIQEGAKGLT